MKGADGRFAIGFFLMPIFVKLHKCSYIIDKNLFITYIIKKLHKKLYIFKNEIVFVKKSVAKM